MINNREQQEKLTIQAIKDQSSTMKHYKQQKHTIEQYNRKQIENK
jgi:hypothetical protein